MTGVFKKSSPDKSRSLRCVLKNYFIPKPITPARVSKRNAKPRLGKWKEALNNRHCGTNGQKIGMKVNQSYFYNPDPYPIQLVSQ